MSLFCWGNFTSHSGAVLSWKLECDALTPEDWDCLAHLVASRVAFRHVRGIPTGGYPFARALQPHRTPSSHVSLLVDDVYSTGNSMLEHLAPGEHGVVLFSRVPAEAMIARVKALFHLSLWGWGA